MLTTIKTAPVRAYLAVHNFLNSPRSEAGEESASTAALTGIILVIIIAVLVIFRDGLSTAFNRIKEMLTNF
ncbi:MAG: hypothetical protein EHM70_14325 [Chloroflexota bacterium]|nr:MAG: hypothetical protein EHM70_14325 [Chloroflexota bacterium]